MNIGTTTGGGAPSAQMIQQMQKRMFATLDSNTDGGIDKTELSQFAQDHGLDTSKVDEMFQTADSDGSGAIDESENAAVMEKIADRMKSMFGKAPSGGAEAADSSSDSNDALMEMLNKVREHSQQHGGTNTLQQFLDTLNQQGGGYTQQGNSAKSDVSLLLTQLA